MTDTQTDPQQGLEAAAGETSPAPHPPTAPPEEPVKKAKNTGLGTDIDVATYFRLQTGAQLAIVTPRGKRKITAPKVLKRRVDDEGTGFEMIGDVTKVVHLTINAAGITIEPSNDVDKPYRPPQEKMAEQLGFSSASDVISWAGRLGADKFTATYLQNVREEGVKA